MVQVDRTIRHENEERVVLTTVARVLAACVIATGVHIVNFIVASKLHRFYSGKLFFILSVILTFGICFWPAVMSLKDRRWWHAVLAAVLGYGAGWGALLAGTFFAAALLGSFGGFP